MQGLWPLMNRCWSSMLGRARKTTDRSVSLDLIQARQEIGNSGEDLDRLRAKKRQPIYLRFSSGREGRRKGALLWLDDDESQLY